MSADRWLRAASGALLRLASASIGWICVAPIAILMPRRRDWMAVIGRDEGKFTDNAKYFLLQGAALLRPAVRVAFVTERVDVADQAAGCGAEVLRYPGPAAIWFLLRANTIVVDSIEWVLRYRRFLTIGARVLQLWHGVAFKRIELDKWRNEVSAAGRMSSPPVLALRIAMHRFTGRLIRYDAVNTTSEFYRDHVFEPAFLSRHFVVAGYPRNTFGELDGIASELAWRGVDPGIRDRLPEWNGRRIIIVAPTFRDSRASPMGLSAEVLAMLDDWCERNAVEIVFKFHPLETQAAGVTGRHLHRCSAGSDLYPLMPLSSAMVTDYSSIYMDYLLLDKPVLFLVPDLADYVRVDRQFQFDFESMTPGPKVSTWRELVDAALREWDTDSYQTERNLLKQKAFDGLPQREAVPKLIAFMRERAWLPPAQA